MIFDNPLIPLALDLASPTPETRLRAARRLAQQLAVPGFLETLRGQRLTCLLYHTLTQFNREEVGEIPLLEELRRDYLAGLRGYRNQMREACSLARELSESGVEIILLKGADIRHRLYDDPVCRPMSDLDVLIAPADLEKVRASLEQQGYTLISRDLDLRPGFTARFGWVVCYQSPGGGLPQVDVHWEIQEAGTFFRLPYPPLRARAVPLELHGVPVLVLAPEHLIMHLGLHIFDELEEAYVLKIVDLYLALRRFSLDWALFCEDAARFRLQEPVLWILREMARWCPDLVPTAVLEELGEHRPGWAERFIMRRQAGGMLVSSLMALWAHRPLRTWPSYFLAKIWPSSSFLKANAHFFAGRKDYLRHIMGRTSRKT
uniref:Nucleotidyltransferase family protein n=1 Tax=Desulfobacca acetoxidans TaxID=60893 RepID=A0A7C3V371_9BACT